MSRMIRCINNNIDKLKLNSEIINKLHNNNINSVEELWIQKRMNLKDMGFSNDEINLIIIELQLLGLDLNKKKY